MYLTIILNKLAQDYNSHLTPNIMQKTLTSFLFVCFFGILSISCHKKGSYATLQNINGNEVISCNVDEISDSVDFLLSNMIDECELVKLETSDSSLFGRIHHIAVSENYIVIHSYDQVPVKLFDRKGKFIRNIGAIGHGPGEYNALYGIQIDEPNNRIYLTPFAGVNKLVVYDIMGKYIQDIPLAFSSPKCRVYVENEKITVLSMPFDSVVPVAYQQTHEGKLIKKLPVVNHLILQPDFSSEITSSHNSGEYDLQILGFGSGNYDTLYYYNADLNKLIPKYVNSYTGKRQGSMTYELRRYYWSWLFDDYNGKRVIVNKETLKSDFFRLINDFHGNIEIKDFFMSNDGLFAGSISAIDLVDQISELMKSEISNENKEKLSGHLENLDENDNPILFLGKMK